MSHELDQIAADLAAIAGRVKAVPLYGHADRSPRPTVEQAFLYAARVLAVLRERYGTYYSSARMFADGSGELILEPCDLTPRIKADLERWLHSERWSKDEHGKAVLTSRGGWYPDEGGL